MSLLVSCLCVNYSWVHSRRLDCTHISTLEHLNCFPYHNQLCLSLVVVRELHCMFDGLHYMVDIASLSLRINNTDFFPSFHIAMLVLSNFLPLFGLAIYLGFLLLKKTRSSFIFQKVSSMSPSFKEISRNYSSNALCSQEC